MIQNSDAIWTYHMYDLSEENDEVVAPMKQIGRIQRRWKTFWSTSMILQSMYCRRGETTYAMGRLRSGPNYVLEDSREGSVLTSTIERNTRSTQVQGSHKEITPLLLLYSVYMDRWVVQQWLSPSSL
jgi:hypothetical protein